MPEFMDFGAAEPRVFYFQVAGRKYALKEADVDANVKYNNKILENVTIGPDMKPSKMGNVADAEPYLVHLCCFFINEEEGDVTLSNKRVPEATIRAWRPSVLKTLVKWIKENSDLMDAGEDGDPEGNE